MCALIFAYLEPNAIDILSIIKLRVNKILYLFFLCFLCCLSIVVLEKVSWNSLCLVI